MITRPDLTDAEELKSLQAIEVAARNLIAALDKLDDGCRHPGFRGFHNTGAQRAAVGGPTGAQS